MRSTSCSMAQANFARLLKEARQGKIIVVEQESGDKVAMIAAGELESLVESVHLLRSPKNAQRLFSALEGTERGEKDAHPETMDELRVELGLAKQRTRGQDD